MSFFKQFFVLSFAACCYVPFRLVGAPHHNLTNQDAWCWMNASLQCLASLDPVYDGLRQKFGDGSMLTVDQKKSWEYRIYKTLLKIRGHSRKQLLVPSSEEFKRRLAIKVTQKIYDKAFETGLTGDLRKKAGWDSRQFTQNVIERLFGEDGLLSEWLGKMSFIYSSAPDEPTVFPELLSVDLPINEKTFVEVGDDPFKSYPDYPVFRVEEFRSNRKPGKPSLSFSTDRNAKGIQKKYELFAATLSNGGHTTAIVKDDDPLVDTWYFYDDVLGVDIRVVRPDEMNTLFYTGKYYGNEIRILFFKAKLDNSLEARLALLKQQLSALQQRLQALKKSLGGLKNKLKT